MTLSGPTFIDRRCPVIGGKQTVGHRCLSANVPKSTRSEVETPGTVRLTASGRSDDRTHGAFAPAISTSHDRLYDVEIACSWEVLRDPNADLPRRILQPQFSTKVGKFSRHFKEPIGIWNAEIRILPPQPISPIISDRYVQQAEKALICSHHAIMSFSRDSEERLASHN
jgi:hypothetical protein